MTLPDAVLGAAAALSVRDLAGSLSVGAPASTTLAAATLAAFAAVRASRQGHLEVFLHLHSLARARINR